MKKKVIRKKAGMHKRYASGFQYQQDSIYFAQIAENLIKLGAQELTELGATEVKPSFRGIYFKAEKKIFYKINYMTRVVSRILAPVVSFPCEDSDTLYKMGKKIKWENLISRKQTFAIKSNVSDSNINHSQFASLRLKDAVADYFRETTGKRPDVDTDNPDLQINLHIRNNKADISIDASGGAPLHKRGYREETVAGPMQETIAAAIIKFTEWDGSVPLYDPMCGSGTLLCEALMHYCHIPAGIFREKFGFEIMPDFNPDLWKQVKKECDTNIIELPKGIIAGSDISEDSVNAVKTNLMGLHYGSNISIEQQDFNNIPSLENSIIVINPPYGIRMGKDQDLNKFHKRLGDFLKQKCKGSTAYIYFGDQQYISQMGIKATWKKPLKAGGLDGRLVKYNMY
ncbi:MAG: class I SAM-dependent RNA methyltransferase [Thermodesulfobacteriota bacterium]|nr:class I SAM-dependent RNA methyltransferase [Thermodesulfobacteriota bacterium]